MIVGYNRNGKDRVIDMRQKMKRGFFLFFIWMIAGCTQQVCAKEVVDEAMVEVMIEESQLSLELPASCHLLRQEIPEDDEYIVAVGADREQIQAYYKEAGIVLHAIAASNEYEVVVTVNDNQDVRYMHNLSSLGEEQIEELAESICDSYRTYEYDVDEYEIYESENAKYLVFHFGKQNEEREVYCMQYYTIKGSFVYHITLRCFEAPITNELNQMMQQIINSVSFYEQEEMMIFEDAESGVTLKVKEGWNKLESDETSYVLAQYMHSNGLGESIQVVCTDVWGSLDVLRQVVTTRAELDTQRELTQQELENFESYFKGFFQDYTSVYCEKLGDYWYICSDEPQNIALSDGDSVYCQKSKAMLKNGILYVFQYGYYDENNIHEDEFEKLVETATYEDAELLRQDEEHYQAIAKLGYCVLAVIAVVVLVVSLVLFLYFKGNVVSVGDE